MKKHQNSIIHFDRLDCYKVSLLFLLITGLVIQSINAQVAGKLAISVIARPTSDSIMLRWAPNSSFLWQTANKIGYVVERFTLMQNGKLVRQPKGTVVTPNPLKPLPLKQWEPFSKIDDYIGVAAQAIYGESFEISANKKTGIMDIVNKATEQENRFTFALFSADQSPLTAKLSGLWFTDKNVKKGEAYLYRVYLSTPSIFKVDTGYVYTSVDDSKPLPKPFNLHATFNDKVAMITWNKQGTDRFYNSFFIEKSIDHGKTFVKANQKPFVNPVQEGADEYPFYFYIDSLKDNNLKYYYRIYGVSPFGETGPVSDTISGTGMDKIKDNPHIVKKEIINGKQVELTWEFPKERAHTISGFKVLRSKKDETGFKIISDRLRADCRTYTDTTPLSVNYYKIVAFKEGGVSTISLSALVQMPDSIPPSPPIGLTAKADTTGILVLRWKANTEPDIYGYRVYRGNSKNEEFSQITVAPVRDTFFIDKINLKTLTKHVYFQVLAVDQRQNFSGFSEVLEVKRPDIIPPLAPVITGIESGKKGIVIHWVNSTSEDVVSHTLYRKGETDKNWTAFKIFTTDSISYFIDSTATPQTAYNYMMKAKDESGLESSPSKVVVAKYICIKPIVNTDITYTIDRGKNCITLRWNKLANTKEYQLYRAINDNTLSLFSVFNGDSLTYTDTNLTPETRYSYLIKAVTTGNVVFYKQIIISF